MESFLVGFTVCLALAFLLSELFLRLGYPRVIGQIIAGVILGLPFIRGSLFGAEGVTLVSSLSDIGVVFLMLLVGTEIKVHELRKASKRAATLALLGYLIPLIIGYVVMRALGFDSLIAIIVAICLSISAEAITIDILMEYGILNTVLGTTVMEAGMIDDMLGVFSLALIIAFLGGPGESLAGIDSILLMVGQFTVFIAISVFLGFFILPKVAKLIWKEKSEAAVLSLAVIFGLIIVLLSMSFKQSSVVGAFVAGLIIQMSIKNRQEEKEIVESLNIVTFGLIIPFFFIYTGMSLDLEMILQASNILLVALITAVALSGKLIAAHLTGVLYHIRPADRTLLGWGMNPRGAVELIIANLALSKGLISTELFSAVVSMAVLSALISPVMFKRTLLSGESSVSPEPLLKHSHHQHASEKAQ